MKVNILIPTRSGGKFAGDSVHSSLTGEATNGPMSPEDEIITALDERKMNPEKLIVTRFLIFLGNQRLTLSELKKLPELEQARIKKEFLEG